MAQHDYVIANQAGAAFRSDLNDALAAIVSLNSGAAAPSTTYGNLLWVDTTNNLAKKRDNANANWRTFADKDFLTWLLGDGTVSLPAYSFNGDTDCGMYRIGANNLGIGVNGAKVLDIGTAGLGVVGVLTAGDGAVGAPSISFTSDPDSGMYRIGANNIGVAVNGAKVLDIATTGLTVTGKISSRIEPRVGSTTSSATPTINTDNVDFYHLTAQTADITSFTTNLSGTPTDNQRLMISVTGTAARAITWGASFESGAATLPTTTVTTQRLDVLFVWNAVSSKWRCMATGSA